jgi:NAD(P)-dependent dehydrogenase (short-subunit alcohol dehydrogenase family)
VTGSDGASRVAVVSGAASGIGAAVAAELSECGWQVAGLDLHPSGWDLGLVVQMAQAEDVTRAVREVEDKLGPVSAVVSAAGHYAMVPVQEIGLDAWRQMLRVHLGGLLHLSRAVLPGMTARGSGDIVAITSELAIGGGDGDAHYAAAKGAVIGFVRSLAAEVASTGVRVNAVAPGPTDTPLLAADSPWREPTYLSTLPLRRLAAPEEIALTVAFLLGEGTFCVGEIVSPNCGAVI